MYEDFVNKVLPEVQEGLVISYEYFIDLFGRYVTYLLITDIINFVITLLVLITSSYFIYKFLKYIRRNFYDLDEFSGTVYVVGVMILGGIVLSALYVAPNNAFSIVKTIYIPEVRVYEELQKYKNTGE